jgi:hypothetical protein
MAIEAEQRVVYRSSMSGRRFMTLKGAVYSDARKILRTKYPNERPEYEGEFGQMTSPGFTWMDLPRSDVMFRRLCRLLITAYKEGDRRGN